LLTTIVARGVLGDALGLTATFDRGEPEDAVDVDVGHDNPAGPPGLTGEDEGALGLRRQQLGALLVPQPQTLEGLEVIDPDPSHVRTSSTLFSSRGDA
jgi:hypothetical protein